MTHINNINSTSPGQNNSHNPTVLEKISQILIDATESSEIKENTVLSALLKNLNKPSSTDPRENLQNLDKIKSILSTHSKLPTLTKISEQKNKIRELLKQYHIDISTIEKEIIKEQQSVINTYTQMLTQMNSREKELGEEIMHLEQTVKQSALKEKELLNEIEKLRSELLEQGKQSSSDQMTKSAQDLRQILNKKKGA